MEHPIRRWGLDRWGVGSEGIYLFSCRIQAEKFSIQETYTGFLSSQWVQWHPKAHVLIAATEDGSLYMWQVPGGQCKVHQAAGAITAAEFFPDGKSSESEVFWKNN